MLNLRSRRDSMGPTYSHCAVHPVRSGTDSDRCFERDSDKRVGIGVKSNNLSLSMPAAHVKGRRRKREKLPAQLQRAVIEFAARLETDFAPLFASNRRLKRIVSRLLAPQLPPRPHRPGRPGLPKV